MEWKSGPRPLTDLLDLPPHSVSVKLVWGGVRNPAHLFPSNVNRSERAVWSEVGHRLSNEAAIRLFRPREKVSMTGNRSVDSVYLQQIAKKYPGLRISMQDYINIDGFNLVLKWTADGTTNFRQMRDRCVAEIRADFRRSLEGVMADVDLVRSVFQASADSYIAEEIPSYALESGERQPVPGPLASGEDGLRQVVQHVTTTQNIAEAREGEDLALRRSAFLSKLQKGLEAYAKRDKDFCGLAVGLLNPEEATMGYRMVYVPASGGGRPAQVHLSMSTVGTMHLRSREEVLHDLARGMTRHKERRQKIDTASLERTLMEFLKDAVSMDLVEKKEGG